MQISQKVVLITGASQGIGAACAREFQSRGALLSLNARDSVALKRIGGEKALIIPADLYDESARERIVAETISHFGRIDILINNAGVGLCRPAHQASMENTRALFELNFFIPLDLIQRVTPHMKRQGGGAIINVGSIASKMTLPWFTLYSSSKHALASLTDGLRMELRQDGIHAMNVCPGYVRTAFQSHVLDGTPANLGERARRWAISAPQCARDIANGLERKARTVVTPSSGWLLLAAASMFPATVHNRLERHYLRQQQSVP